MGVWTLFDSVIGDRKVSVPGLATANNSALLTGPSLVAFSNLSATTDPTSSNDATQGYSVGSVWFNSTAGYLRTWICRDNTASAAKWVFEGADYGNGGTTPNIEVVQFGSGSNAASAEGNIYREVVASRNPGGTAADYVVGTFSLSASSFDATGRGVNLLAQGSVANNTNSKRIKLYWNCTTATLGSVVTGGTVIADTGAYTTAAAVGWTVESNVFKYGANGSNTQLALHVSAQIGSVVGSLLVPTATTATESGAILCAVTANAATTATDIVYNFFEINALN